MVTFQSFNGRRVSIGERFTNRRGINMNFLRWKIYRWSNVMRLRIRVGDEWLWFGGMLMLERWWRESSNSENTRGWLICKVRHEDLIARGRNMCCACKIYKIAVWLSIERLLKVRFRDQRNEVWVALNENHCRITLSLSYCFYFTVRYSSYYFISYPSTWFVLVETKFVRWRVRWQSTLNCDSLQRFTTRHVNLLVYILENPLI